MPEQKAKFEIVVSNVIERHGKYLLVQEKKNARKDKYGNKWNLPGGSLEHGEGFLDCAVREGEEETTLILKPTHWIPQTAVVNFTSRPESDLLSIIVKSRIIKGRPIATEDVADVKWFSLDKIREMKQQKKLKALYVIDSIEACNSGKIIRLRAIRMDFFLLP